MKRTTKLFLSIVLIASGGTVSAQQIKNAIPYAAQPLPLSAVRITGGPLKRAQDLDAEYLLKLEPDRMLAYYRKRAGLQPKAEVTPVGMATGAISPDTLPGIIYRQSR